MRSKFKWIFTLLLALSMQFSFAQEKTVTGVVSDKSGPLPGANVVVKGTKRSTQTDFDGKYSIKAKTGEVLVISFTGYNNSTVTVGAANSYNVSLKEESVALGEVVILGYDKTATKAKSVAAATTISSESLKNRPNVSVLQSLAGNAAGLNVLSSSGSPGSSKFDLIIRGYGSINSSSDPLFVIDGVPANGVVFRSLNPEDIDVVSVLKDASATSIYGNRGANGVIVIKTKTGKYDSNFKVSYSSTYGVSELPANRYNLMNSQQLLGLQRTLGVGAGSGQSAIFNSFLGRDPANLDPLTDAEIAKAPTHNWLKTFFRTSYTQTHNINLSSGGKNLNQFSSLSYVNQSGIVNNTDFQRFTLRNNLNGKSNDDRFTFSTNMTVAFSKRNEQNQENPLNTTSINNNSIQNPLLGGLVGVPFLTPASYPGSGQGLYDLIGSDFGNGNSTLVLYDNLQTGNIPNQINELKILSNLNLNYKLTKTISFDSKVGVDYTAGDRVFARSPASYLAVNVRESNAVPYGGYEFRRDERDFAFNAVNSLHYDKTFGKHTIGIGAYTEYNKAVYTRNQLKQNGLDLLTWAFGSGTGWSNVGGTYASLRPVVTSTKSKAGSFSYFADLVYDYSDKYGLDLVVRRDASYRFINDFKWGTFWSIGSRWNIDKESFMDKTAFNMLKLRFSYGIQGNQNLGVSAYGNNPLYSSPNLSRDLDGTTNGYGNSNGYDLSQFGNNTLRWENQKMSNLGLDFGLWNDRISGNVDVYDKTTSDLFSSIALSASAGAGTGIAGNNGKIENKGVELALRLKVFRGENFNLELYANGSYNKNKILAIDKPILDTNGGTIYDVGTQVGELWYVPYAGVNPANGNLLFYDVNNNLTENPDPINDRRKSGKSNIPIYQGGFGFNMDYKGFYLGSQFSWVKDVYRFDGMMFWLYNPGYMNEFNGSTDLLNAWTPTNTSATIPALNANNYSLGYSESDIYVRDASYVRLRNVSFGYNFNKKLLAKSGISALKIFVQGENLYTWTKWRGLDPDSGEASNLGRYPNPKTVSFGVNVEF